MAALSQMMSPDPDEREQVRRILHEHPGLEAFSERDREWATWLLAQSGFDSLHVFVTVLPYTVHRRSA